MDKKIKKLIEENTVALATVNKDKTPHVIAVACVKVKDESIIITDNYMKKTIENIEKNNNVSLAVWNDKVGYEISGDAEYYNSGKWLKFVKSLKNNKGYPAKGAIVIKINKIRRLA